MMLSRVICYLKIILQRSMYFAGACVTHVILASGACRTVALSWCLWLTLVDAVVLDAADAADAADA